MEVRQQGETLADLKTALVEAQEAQEKMAKEFQTGGATLEQYEQSIVATKAAQGAYNAEMRISVKESTAVKGSYNDLVNQLARLKEEWKQADPGTENFRALTKQVNETKEQLGAMDHSIGNWQRNVGNYGNSIASVAGLFGGAGRAASGAISGIKGMTMGLKTLSATPVIAIIGLLVGLLGKLKEAFKSSEEASNRMSVALAPLQAGGQLLKIVFQEVAEAVAKAAEWLGKMAERLGLFSERMKENQSLAKDEIALQKRRREVTVENAKLELEAERQRNVARDKANKSIRERLAALEAAKNTEKQILENELEIARKEYDIAKRKAALAANNREENDALAAAEAKLYQVQTSYEKGMARLTAQYSSAQIELRGEIKKTAGVVEESALLSQDALDKLFAKADKIVEERRKRLAEERAAFLQTVEEQNEAWDAETEANIAAFEKEQAAMAKASEAHKRQTISNYQQISAAISSVLNDVAGAYQNEIKMRVQAGEISEQQGEREFENVKALQYAVTWINTLAAMVGALADPSGGPWFVRVANAAAALATGVANTIQIANTQLGSTSTASATGKGVQTAPTVQVAVPEYRTITTASDEQALNERAASQKVYLVTSELEAHQRGQQVALAESTF